MLLALTFDSSSPVYEGLPRFKTINVLTDDDKEWFAPGGSKTSWFMMKLASAATIGSFKLRNPKKSWNRYTDQFKIEVSETKSETFQVAASGNLNKDQTLFTIASSINTPVRYIKFTASSYHGVGAGLQYLAATRAETTTTTPTKAPTTATPTTNP